MEQTDIFATEKISKILFKLAPPVMLAQLIQALYNIVDSLFVGRYSDSGLTALSIIYPIQLLMIAFAVGTGVGINTVMSARLGTGNRRQADEYAGVGTPLAIALWFLFAAVCYLIMPFYARMSTGSEAVIRDVIVYGRIVCIFSFGLFAESVWTKILQSNGDMKTPMIAQIIGAVTNIILDPILIFGLFGLPEMGIAGAAAATVIGQIAAALAVMKKGFRKYPAAGVYPHHIAEAMTVAVVDAFKIVDIEKQHNRPMLFRSNTAVIGFAVEQPGQSVNLKNHIGVIDIEKYHTNGYGYPYNLHRMVYCVTHYSGKHKKQNHREGQSVPVLKARSEQNHSVNKVNRAEKNKYIIDIIKFAMVISVIFVYIKNKPVKYG